MRKRKLGILLAGLMVVTALTACGADSVDRAAESTTELFTGFNGFDSPSSKTSSDYEGAAEYETSQALESAGASAPDSYDYAEEGYADSSYDSSSSYDNSSSSSEGYVNAQPVERKIIYYSSLVIETKKFDEDVTSLRSLVTEAGGYFESSDVNGRADAGSRSGYYVIRIPSEKYESFMAAAGDIGAITSKNESVDDITSNYVDVQARITSLQRKIARLEDLEAQATTVEDLLSIEDRINDAQYELESYQSQLKVYDDRVDYCTVNVSINEVYTYTEPKADTFWNRVAKAFTSSISGFVTFLQWLVIILVFLLPYIVVIAVIVLLIIFIVKRRKKAKNKKTPIK